MLSYVTALLAPTYSASKAALRFYTESLRKHLEIIGSTVKVFELLPPLVDTDMTAGLNEQKMSTEEVIKLLIAGITKDEYTIRVGATITLTIPPFTLTIPPFNLTIPPFNLAIPPVSAGGPLSRHDIDARANFWQ